MSPPSILKTIRPLALVVLAGGAAQAHDFITTKLTWSREVSRIVYRRCVGCHSEGSSAFPLTTYEAARPWAQAIKEEVLSRRMPPWFAVKGFGEFQNDVALTQEEIEIISDWVEGGAPKGNEALLPKPPDPDKPAAKGGPKAPRSIELKGDVTLKQSADIFGIRPVRLEQGASLRLIAERPDGALTPLIWVYNYNPRFPQTFYFKSAIKLPPGSRIRMNPPGAGVVALLVTAKPKRES